MEIKTEYNIGDTVFFLYDNRIQMGVICGMIIKRGFENPANIGITSYIVSPVVGGEIKLAADKLFKTKEDLVESLL